MKIPNIIYKKALKDKKLAKQKIANKKWMAESCEISKEWAEKTSKQSIYEIAKYLWQYLQYRAKAKGNYFGSLIYIDKPAREEYLKCLKDKKIDITK